jgi:dolichol-phosphate mannosyltransferase
MSDEQHAGGLNMPPDLSIVIPCFNEEDGLGRLVASLGPAVRELAASRTVEVVLVDDGSTDNTWSLLTRLTAAELGAPIRTVRHDVNRGLGAALRTGFGAAHGQVIVTTDSDATYRYSEIPALLAKLTPDVSMVTASPYHPDGGVAGVSRSRLVLSRGSSFIYRTLVDPRVHTYTSLFRAYRAEVVRNVTFEANGFLAVAELLVKAMQRGYRVAEYPTVLHSRVAGTSKAKLVRTIVAHLRFQFGLVCGRLGKGTVPGETHEPRRALNVAGQSQRR